MKWAQPRRLVLATLACIGLFGLACGAKSTAQRARSTILADAVQPPDPCQLLHTDDISRVMGEVLANAGHGDALPANAFDGGLRACAWTAPRSGLLSLVIETQAALQAAEQAMQRITGHAVPDFQVGDLLNKMDANEQSVPGIGDGALLVTRINDDVELRVVRGQTGFRVGAIGFHSITTSAHLMDLARIVLDRLVILTLGVPTSNSTLVLCEFVATRDIPPGTLGESAVQGGAFKPILVQADKWPVDAIIDLNVLGDKNASVAISTGTPITHAQWIVNGLDATGLALPNPGSTSSTGRAGSLC